MTTPIPPLPPVPQASDRTNFPTKTENFVAALSGWATAVQLVGNEAEAAATSSATSATASATSATASAASVLALQSGVTGTSSTSVAVATGSKAFVVEAGKAWVAGMRLRAVDATLANLMDGEVSGYSGTTLTILVDRVEGGGTIAGWTIVPIGPVGPVGPLSNFTENLSTAAPNATVPVASLLANNAAVNVDFALSPKGSGALLAQVPDSTVAGGNKRGTNAVDLQKTRGAATQVASGTWSVIGGGRDNTASAQGSTVGGGEGNAASGAVSAVAGGSSNTASGAYSCIAGGIYNTASGQSSAVAGGYYGSTRGIRGVLVWPGDATNSGRTQTARYVLRADTADATSTRLTAQGAAASADNGPILPNNAAYYCRVRVLAFNTATSSVAKSWVTTVLIRRTANAASTVIVGTPTVTNDFGDAGLASASVAVSADTTNGGLAVTATGIAATNIRWVAHVETLETTTA